MRWTTPWSFEDDMSNMMRELQKWDSNSMKGFVPSVDMYQTDTGVVVETPLPGVDPDDVSISVENDVLTIQGKTEKKNEVDEKNYWRKEIRTGSFYRQVALPTHVVSDKAEANFADGILKVTIPKATQVKAKKIEIKNVKMPVKKTIKK